MEKLIQFIKPNSKSSNLLEILGIPINCCSLCTLSSCKLDTANIRCSLFVHYYDRVKLSYDIENGFSYNSSYINSLVKQEDHANNQF